MYINLESDYAIRIVSCLAQAGRRMDAKTLAQNTDVTLRFALKILHKLASGGVVLSYKGAGGGYELARPLSQISLKTVIDLVQGEYAFSRCLGESFCCSQNDGGMPCRFRQVFSEISDIVKQKLARATFDQLVDLDEKKAPQ